MKKLIGVGSAVLMVLVAACGSQVVQFPEDGTGTTPVDGGNILMDGSSMMDGNGLSDASDASDAADAADGDADADSSMPPPPPVCLFPVIGSVNLGTADSFAILAKAGVSTVPASAVTGDVGVSPIARIGLTGWSEAMDSSNVFSTSTQVTGKLYASDYTAPTPANMTTAISDMETAFTDAAGRAPSVTELGAGDISGMTLSPGVYKWSTGLLINTNVTLNGNCGDVWIFEIARDLTVANNANVFLSGGAVPKNVFWQVSGKVDVGTGAHVEGTVLTQTQIAMSTLSSVNGRLLAQTAVTLQQTTVVKP